MLVSRGGTPIGELAADDVPAEYREIATRLRLHASFVGSDCCWGDRYIAELSDGRRIARRQHEMRAVATCHHLTVVALERAELAPAPVSVAGARAVRSSSPAVPSL